MIARTSNLSLCQTCRIECSCHSPQQKNYDANLERFLFLSLQHCQKFIFSQNRHAKFLSLRQLAASFFARDDIVRFL
jgi:hypothetical protein